MSLREKYAAAMAERPRKMTTDQVQMNYALQTFTAEIPQIITGAMERLGAGMVLNPRVDPEFMRETDITGGIRHFNDMREKLKKLSDLPAMQALKAYLSDPGVDMSFTARVAGKYVGGSYIETLRLAVNPELPFELSTIEYADASKRETLRMTENDKMAWAAGAKPKIAPPARLTKP